MLSAKLMQKLYALYYQQLKTPTCVQSEGFRCCQSARQRQQNVWVGRRWRGSTLVQNVWRTPMIIYGIICLTCLHKTYDASAVYSLAPRRTSISEAHEHIKRYF